MKYFDDGRVYYKVDNAQEEDELYYYDDEQHYGIAVKRLMDFVIDESGKEF